MCLQQFCHCRCICAVRTIPFHLHYIESFACKNQHFQLLSLNILYTDEQAKKKKFLLIEQFRNSCNARGCFFFHTFFKIYKKKISRVVLFSFFLFCCCCYSIIIFLSNDERILFKINLLSIQFFNLFIYLQTAHLPRAIIFM